MSSTEIKEAVLQLPEAERAELADLLMDSLSTVDPGIEAAWIKESSDRLEAYSKGEIDAVDAEDVLKRLRTRIG